METMVIDTLMCPIRPSVAITEINMTPMLKIFQRTLKTKNKIASIIKTARTTMTCMLDFISWRNEESKTGLPETT